MRYLSPQEILYIHSRIVDELGVRHGINDIMVLKKLIKYVHNAEIFPDKFSKAAALFFGIARKKPFAGKNLETGIAVLEIFLNLNKYSLDISDTSFKQFLQDDLRKSKVEDIRRFLIKNASPLSKN